MRIIGFIFSILFHVGLITLALTWSVSSPTKISLDKPIYKVDLVSLAPAPKAPVVKKAPAPAPAKVSKPEAVSIPKKQPAAPVAKVKAEPTQKPAPKVPPKPKAKPKAKPISPKKVETHSTTKKKTPEKKPKPVKKKSPAPVKKTAPAKKPEPSGEDLLAGALSDLRKEVDKKEKAERAAVARELAGLRSEAQANAAQIEGDGTASATGLVQVYGQIVRQEVKKNWRFPVFGGHQQEMTAAVEIALKSDGTITGVRIVKSSGNADFDDSVLSALKDTEVLPEPPGNSIKKIVVNFNLHDLDN
ncbi:cell envelope integrity protein TolA [Maridesulfovibrio bastinii]|uniref:cell envelope integrity protein TolA n=1 Tax=Maridesulfovibrio bastinii TaxID=47157 RepID=UPI000419544A|nr:cell envelope integrity protein TolA [Maridesulfovibrio bastinii]